MGPLSAPARLMISAGLALVVLGLLFQASQGIAWFRIGRLPGDIRIERENMTFYFPITTMVLFSLVLTGISLLIRWFQK